MKKSKPSQFTDNVILLVCMVVLVSAVLLTAHFGQNKESLSGAAISGRVADTGETTEVLDEITKEIGIGAGIANTSQPKDSFDLPIRIDDISTLQDSTISFYTGTGYNDYDVSEQIWFAQDSPSIETALSTATVDKYYEGGVGMEVAKGSIIYYYVFDEAINVSTVLEEHPLDINFMGRNIKITNVGWSGGTTDRITAKVGEMYLMYIGDSLELGSHVVKIEDIGETTVSVSIDGGTPLLLAEDETYNWAAEGIAVDIDAILYNGEDSSVQAFIGESATTTYIDEDPFIDESGDNWVWEIADLGLESSTDFDTTGTPSGPVLAVKNEFIIDSATHSDPETVVDKGCYDMTKNVPFLQLCIDGLTVKDEDYMTVDVYGGKLVDLGDVGIFYSIGDALPVLSIISNKPNSLRIDESQLNSTAITSDVATDAIYLVNRGDVNTHPNITVFYEDSSGVIQAAGDMNDIAAAPTLSVQPFAYVDYKSTTGTDVVFGLNGVDKNSMFSLNITSAAAEIPGDTDRISLYVFNSSAATFDAINDIYYVNDLQDISLDTLTPTVDKDVRTEYGIVIKDPEGRIAESHYQFSIPGDVVKAKVSLKAVERVSEEGTLISGQAQAVPEGIEENISGQEDLTGEDIESYAAEEEGFDFLMIIAVIATIVAGVLIYYFVSKPPAAA